MIFREANIADLPRLLELEQAVVEFERAFNPSIKAGNVKYYNLERLLEDDWAYLMVAELATDIIGSGYAQIRESKSSLAHLNNAYLGFMFVAPEHRGLGIAQKIIDRLVEWSVENGVRDLYLDVYAKNESAISAYRKAGFRPSLLEMSLHLGPEKT